MESLPRSYGGNSLPHYTLRWTTTQGDPAWRRVADRCRAWGTSGEERGHTPTGFPIVTATCWTRGTLPWLPERASASASGVTSIVIAKGGDGGREGLLEVTPHTPGVSLWTT